MAFNEDQDFYTINSVLVFCGGELDCASDCMGRACGEMDSCGNPCVGLCTNDDYYCSVSEDVFECKQEVYGHVSAYFPMLRSSAMNYWFDKRDYSVPTMTNFENAFKDDINYLSQGIIPQNSVVILDVDYMGAGMSDMAVTARINLDQVNEQLGTDYDMLTYLYYLGNNVFSEDNIEARAGTYTRMMDPESYAAVFTTGGSTSEPADNSNEWYSFSVHSSWVSRLPESSAAGSLSVAVTMLAAAVLAVVAW